MRSLLRFLVLAALSTWLLSAAAVSAEPASLRLLIFGEQHDQPDQQRQVADEVRRLAASGRLAGVVLEMAESPHGTAGLARDASEAQVRDALQWRGWPWQAYAAVVMNAVRAGVPVWGGNLPRSAMRDAMVDATLDARVDADVRQALIEAVRSGHCDLLPAAQEPGMVRIQIARDRSMADVIEAHERSAPAGSVLLLLTGAQHAARDHGVPLHLQREHGWPAGALRVVVFGNADDGLLVDERREAVATPQQDHCAALRAQLGASAPAASAGR